MSSLRHHYVIFNLLFQPRLTVRSDVDLQASLNNIDVRHLEKFLRLLLGNGMKL